MSSPFEPLRGVLPFLQELADDPNSVKLAAHLAKCETCDVHQLKWCEFGEKLSNLVGGQALFSLFATPPGRSD